MHIRFLGNQGMKGIKFLSNLSDLFKGSEKSENNARTTANDDTLTVTDTNPKPDTESNTTSLSFPFKAFVSYSHIDQEGMLKLRSALSPLVRQNKLKLWDDQAIDVGTTWGDEINENLTNARIVFCLVSQDFINSDFCYEKELKAALEAHARQEKTVVPIRFRMCHWDDLPLASIQSTPNDGWIKSKEDQDAAWTAVAKSTERLLDKLVAQSDQQKNLIANDHTIKVNNKRNDLEQIQQRKSKIEQSIDEIHEERNELKLSYQSPYKDIVDWLHDNKEVIVDKIFRTMSQEIFDRDIPTDFPQKHSEIRTFKLHIEQIIDSLEVCLLVESTALIEEPYRRFKFKDQYYIDAILLLKKRIPATMSGRSKTKLVEYIDLLISRI